MSVYNGMIYVIAMLAPFAMLLSVFDYTAPIYAVSISLHFIATSRFLAQTRQNLQKAFSWAEMNPPSQPALNATHHQ